MAWTDYGYRPASFRGVPFFVDLHEQTSGRRVGLFEFPLRDAPYTEDLGRRQQHYRIEAYVLGEDYLLQASDLTDACVLDATPGRLVHPYLGEMLVRCVGFRRFERREAGNKAFFDLQFVESGDAASPVPGLDTASRVLIQAARLLQSALNAYGLVASYAGHPAWIVTLAGNALLGLATQMAGLPAGAVASIVTSIQAIPRLTDPFTTGANITGCFSTYAGVVVANPAAFAAGRDASYGLAALANWGADQPPIVPSTPDLAVAAANQAALQGLVRASAAAAIAEIYAQTDFPSAIQAAAARAQLTDLLDQQAAAAADANQPDLYDALIDLQAAVAADLATRAQNLPSQGSYTAPGPLPSLALSWRLYQTCARAGEIAQLNDVPHPAFMPTTGLALYP